MAEFSEEYIQEVRKHKWLQEMWEPKAGAWVVLDEKLRLVVDLWLTPTGEQAIVYSYKEGVGLDAKYGLCMAATPLWLPTLDDLARMLDKAAPDEWVLQSVLSPQGSYSAYVCQPLGEEDSEWFAGDPKIAALRLLAALRGGPE